MKRQFAFALLACVLGAGLTVTAAAQEQTEQPPAGGRVVFEPEGEVPQDVRRQFEQNFEWGESESGTEDQAAAAEAAELQAERERMEAERQRAEEEARRQAEEEARRQAEAERRRAEEEARRQAEAERQRAEAEARRQAEQERARRVAEAGDEEAPPDPEGRIATLEINPDAYFSGEPGVSFTVTAEAQNVLDTRLETAVYIYDSAGNPIMDRDSRYRSARGQVYHGEYRTAGDDPLRWTEALFIPFDQLETPPGNRHDLQAQVVIWEYSTGKGRALARTRMEPFTVVLGPAPMDLAGQWSDGVTISVDSAGAITVDGLDVRGSVENQRWELDGYVLSGVVSLNRRIAADRIARYELLVSEDMQMLSGTYTVETAEQGAVKDEGTVTLTRER